MPYGKVWRLGANEATEITFAKDGSFGGKPVKAGTYTLFIMSGSERMDIHSEQRTETVGCVQIR